MTVYLNFFNYFYFSEYLFRCLCGFLDTFSPGLYAIDEYMVWQRTGERNEIIGENIIFSYDVMNLFKHNVFLRLRERILQKIMILGD